MIDFPAPDPAAQTLSAALCNVIREDIADSNGSIAFARYMERCLYEPGLGYYSAGLQKLGSGGDFVTAPEVSPLFGQCIARSCSAVLASLGGGDILEFGAGSGRLALDLLAALQHLDALPTRYLILERSAELRQRQQETLREYVPQLLDRVSWIDTLPGDDFRGVMLANEVLDAMAVERFQWDGETARLFHVAFDGERFHWQLSNTQDDTTQQIASLCADCELAAGYVSEINAGLPGWLLAVGERLEQGLLLLIDYGYPRHEYYHPQHSNGTLMCHYRQRAHDDPFLWPGLQDITAHVDFTAVAEAAHAAGLDISGYTTQAGFLLDSGLDELLQSSGPGDSVSYMRLAQQAKTLILPGEMGERFKCIALTRGLEIDILGFRMQDYRNRL